MMPVTRGYFIPDLTNLFDSTQSYNPHADTVAAVSDKWLDDGCPGLSPKARKLIYDLRGPVLAAYCYPTCDAYRYRVVADFLNLIFHLDNISDGMLANEADTLSHVVMNALWSTKSYKPLKGMPEEETSASKLTRDFWSRCIVNAGPGVQARFKKSMQLYLQAVHIESVKREEGMMLDFKTYVDLRRDSSGCYPSFDLTEYALGIDLPDFVIEHSVIRALKQGANDLVSWTNDIFSYNVEQARNDTHNIVIVVQRERGLTIQEAMDYAGKLCYDTVESFQTNAAVIASSSFGCSELDKDVATYIQGLQDWITGSVQWSFASRRYFGSEGAEIKKHRFVKLLPKKNDGQVTFP